MTQAEFRALTFFVDEDRSSLGALAQEQRIDYFYERAQMVVLRPLRTIVRGIRPADRRSSAVLCFGTCACCAIEAFGRFHLGLLGEGRGRESFDGFVRDFMSPEFSRRLHNVAYVDLLRKHFRNGLAHGIAIKWGGFLQSNTYLRSQRRGGVWQLVIDPGHLQDDLEQAVAQFVEKLRAAPDAADRRVRFNKTFKALWVKGE